MDSDPAGVEEAASPRSGPRDRLPSWRELRTAMAMLTVLRGRRGTELTVDSSTLFYPLVGLLLGIVWLVTHYVSSLALGRFGSSVVVLLIANGLTGGRPALALGRTLAALLTAADRDAALEQLNGPPTPTVAIMVAAVFIAGLACLSALTAARTIGLLFAPLLGRWSMVVLAIGSRAARADGRRVKFAPEVTFVEFGWTSTITFVIVFGAAEFLGVLLAVGAAGVTVAARVGLHRWLDGVDLTTLDAVCEVVQLVTLGLLVALQ